MNKLYLTGLVLLLASTAHAQTSVTTNYANAVTLTTSNGCRISGVTTMTYDGAGTITTNGTDSCSTTTGNQTANVSLAITPASYTVGSGAAAPTISITNNTPAATVVCTLNPSNGFTVTPSSVTNSGTFTLSTPTTAGTFSFSPTCTTSTAGFNTGVSVSPASVSLTVAANGGGGNGACSASQTTVVGNKTLQRQCTGSMVVYPGPITTYSGDLTDLGAVLGNRAFPNYAYTGYTPTYDINVGYYIALAFTPSAAGSVQLSANTSYGDGGIISLSTAPGALLTGQTGTICSLTRNGSNSLYFGTSAYCAVQQGVTYYINMTDMDTTGNYLCYGGKANTCTTSKLAFTVYTSN